jgi:flagellar biosynthesis/type III secretory pathway chaperone
MILPWQSLAEALRDELQEYGALLHLFEEQQQSLLRRDAEAVLERASRITLQVESLGQSRGRRETLARTLALQAGRPADATLRELTEAFPAEVQPLFRALVDEINRLLHRVKRGARQNALMLQKTVSLHQELLRTVQPGGVNPTYSPGGRVSTLPATASSFQAAV